MQNTHAAAAAAAAASASVSLVSVRQAVTGKETTTKTSLLDQIRIMAF